MTLVDMLMSEAIKLANQADVLQHAAAILRGDTGGALVGEVEPRRGRPKKTVRRKRGRLRMKPLVESFWPSGGEHLHDDYK